MPRRVKELESLIDHLVGESIHLLKAHLEETNSTHPTDFSERVERILCNRNGLEKTWAGLATELRWVDEEEKQVIARKRIEVLDDFPVVKNEEKHNLEELQAEIKSAIGPPLK